MLEVPWISRWRTESSFGGRTQPEFRSGGLAEQDSARVREPHRQLRISRCVPMLVVFRAEGGANVFGPEQILERVRNPEERQFVDLRRACLVEPGRIGKRAIGGDGHKCAEARI